MEEDRVMDDASGDDEGDELALVKCDEIGGGG